MQTYTPAAQLAIKYANMRRTCGRYAAATWYAKQGGNKRLGAIACQLLAAQIGGEL